jgi:hypothetical protein
MNSDSGYICVEMFAPLRIICALEMLMDDRSLSHGMGISPDFIQKNHWFNNCEFFSRKKIKYIYHIF